MPFGAVSAQPWLYWLGSARLWLVPKCSQNSSQRQNASWKLLILEYLLEVTDVTKFILSGGSGAIWGHLGLAQRGSARLDFSSGPASLYLPKNLVA